MVIPIEVATANGVSGELKFPEYQSNYDSSGAYLDAAYSSLRFQRTGKLWRDLHLLTFFDTRNQTSKMFNKIKKSSRLDWFSQVGIKAGVEGAPAVVKHGEPGDGNHGNLVVTW